MVLISDPEYSEFRSLESASISRGSNIKVSPAPSWWTYTSSRREVSYPNTQGHIKRAALEGAGVTVGNKARENVL